MTCFWDGIMSKIPLADMNKYLGGVKNVQDLINLLKARCVMSLINDVEWNGQPLSPKMIAETKEWVANYNAAAIGGGHDCSVCDPFLILICHIFRVNIIHDYNGHKINYVIASTSANSAARSTISFGSNSGHFW